MNFTDEFDVDPEADIVAAGDLPNFRLHETEFDVEGATDISEETLPERNDAPQYILPDVIKNFIVYFHRHIKERNVLEIHSIYENSFNKLTDRYFKNSSWPPVESISPLINHDEVFQVLYKELYYRHIYSKLTPTLENRFESWKNYCALFNLLLNNNPSLELPNQWLWDILDEYIYQFQSFCQFRSKLESTSEEIQQLKNNSDVWNVLLVLKNLHALIKASNIIAILEKEKHEQELTSENSSSLLRMLGYFSIIGLLRVHCLLGDYYLALKVLEPIDLSNKGLYTRVTACHISLYYYLGFAYLMMRRYVDAIKAFSNILLYLSRTKQYHTRSHQFDQIMRKYDQMYALLAIAVTLCPQRIDENIHSLLREKYSDKMVRMQRGDDASFKELFCFACPKFVTAAPLNYDELLSSSNHEALRVQLKLFINEVRQQTLIPTIRSYLKLYTTLKTAKLADFLDVDQEVLRTQLLCVKHKTRNLIWNGGPVLSGKWASSSDVDFYVDQDMIHIANTKLSRRYSEFFIRHILKFEEIIVDLYADHTPETH